MVRLKRSKTIFSRHWAGTYPFLRSVRLEFLKHRWNVKWRGRVSNVFQDSVIMSLFFGGINVLFGYF